MPEQTLTSNGFPIDTSPGRFGEFRASNDVLQDPAALRARMAEDGYLLLRGYLDREVVLNARRELLTKLNAAGDIDTHYPLDEAVFSGQSTWTPAMTKDLRTGTAVRALCHEGRIIQFFEGFLGDRVRSFDFIWVRRVRPGGATGCHYDVVYMGRGTHDLYTAWIPVGDVPFSDGPLMVLENSHRLEDLKSTYGRLDVDRDRDNNPYGGGWFSKNPAEVQERFGGRWLTTEFRAGDVLVFTMFTLHCSLDNTSRRFRFSTDSRYQLASAPVDERWVGEKILGHGERARVPLKRG
ncbi:MAG: hypothetical protein A3F84_02650 [Candidatus Handelsmanbacteria bacterium RIFCSPLOWO2_12_FULL_64_10]|uniref:Phytanoyl-CoA dioxygenase n=1 Tax=Handelsmanbacteria sp. (strain RIFCSPLOWO2_12_FULL_64_10) TaxID=1817868 RepID=A0A1F6CLH3_HANXR|nr:MAG: hypothetical protein A3F84_02650 [Candidatus Handelsmanbacteria bacterium RIFCSPLOWO2_12_FULL_64_10]